MKKIKGSGIYSEKSPCLTPIVFAGEPGKKFYAKIYRRIFNEKDQIVSHEELPFLIKLEEQKRRKK